MAKNTKSRILDAAETLFAAQGYNQTSMREITARADVNLASVNYHFGSKNNLIQAVFGRYFSVLMPMLDHTIDEVQSEPSAEGVADLLRALIHPMMTLRDVSPYGTEKFVMLLARGYNETQGHLRRYIMENYGDTIASLVDKMHRLAPHLSAQELFWRLHFTMGSFVFSMASSQALQEIAEADFNQQIDIMGVIEHLIPFLASGIAAPANEQN